VGISRSVESLGAFRGAERTRKPSWKVASTRSFSLHDFITEDGWWALDRRNLLLWGALSRGSQSLCGVPLHSLTRTSRGRCQVALVAPGQEIYSSYRDGGYAFASGTSHAAPFVSGAVALLKSYGRELGRRLGDRQVKHLLKHTCDRIDDRFRHPKAGYGRLNLIDALRLCEAKLS
jgi:subtilisin family serine protease